MKTKTLDCIDIKRAGALKIHEETKKMSPEQELAYWEKKNRLLREKKAGLKTEA